jgi:hypothetical protein
MAILSNIIGGLTKGIDALKISLGSSQKALDGLAKRQKANSATQVADMAAIEKRLKELRIEAAKLKLNPATLQADLDAVSERIKRTTIRQMQRSSDLEDQKQADLQETERVTMATGRGMKVFNGIMQAGTAIATIAKVGGVGYADAAVKAARGTHMAGLSMQHMMWQGIKLDQALGLGVEESASLVVGLNQIGMAAGKRSTDMEGLAVGIGAVGRLSGVGSAAVLEFYDAQLRVAGASSNGAAAIANLSVEAQKAGLTGKEAFEEMTKHADMELGMDDAAKHEYMRRMLGAAATMKAAGVDMKAAAPKKEGTDRMIRDAGLSSLSGNMFSADEIARKRTNIENGGEGAIQDRIDIAKAQSKSIKLLGGASPEEFNKAKAAAAAGGSSSQAAADFENLKKKTEQAIKVANEATGNSIGEGTVGEIIARLEKENRLSTTPQKEVKAGSIEDTKKAATGLTSSSMTTEDRKAAMQADLAGVVAGANKASIEATSTFVAGVSIAADAATTLGGALKSLTDAVLAIKGASTLTKVGTKATEKAVGKAAGKAAGKVAGKAIGKSLIKKVPVLGLIAGLGFGLQRLMEGDFIGAGGEVLSGAASMIPGPGTAASIALDAGLAARDISKDQSAIPDFDVSKRPGGYLPDDYNPDNIDLVTPRSAAIDETSYGDGTPQSIDPEQHERLLAQGNTVAARQLDSLAATRDLNEQMLAAILNLGIDGFSPLLSGGSRV